MKGLTLKMYSELLVSKQLLTWRLLFLDDFDAQHSELTLSNYLFFIFVKLLKGFARIVVC